MYENILNSVLFIEIMRGRPPRSQIRQNIVEILYHIGSSHGYEIYNIYVDIFPAVSQRSIYYHLRKGVMLKEFRIHKVRKEKGDYSWGNYAEKTYYKLGENSQVRGNSAVKRYFEKKGQKKI